MRDSNRASDYMKTYSVSERGHIFEFDDPFMANVYVILGDTTVFICDTYCGPESMVSVADHINKQGHAEKPKVIFISHADYDHYWGNCHFPNAVILGHMLAYDRVLREGTNTLEKYHNHAKGDVIIVPPNTLFETRLLFVDEGIEFFHTPGHTMDSCSCYDRRDKVLFVGDNVEAPLPYVNHLDIDKYIDTLEHYLELQWKAFVAGHDPVQRDAELIKQNIVYLKKMRDWSVDLEDLPEKAVGVHLISLESLIPELKMANIPERAFTHYKEALDMIRLMEKTERVREIEDKFTEFLKDH